MNLNMYLLSDVLGEYHPFLRANDANRLYLRQVRRLQDWNGVAQSRTVYVGLESDFTNFRFKDQLTAFICIGGTEAMLARLPSLQYILLDAAMSVQEILECVDRCFVRYAEVNERFLNAIITDASLHDIMVCTADFFQNPVFCFDTSMTVLDIVDRYGQAEIDRKKWRSTVERGHVSSQTIAFIAEHYQNTHEAYFQEYAQEQLYMIVVKLWRDREKLLGALIIGDDFKTMNDGFLAIANYVASYISKVIYRKNINNIDYSAIETVFHNLLSGIKCDESYLQAIISPMNWKLTDNFGVCVVPLCAAEKQGEIYNYGAKAIKTAFEDYHIGCFYSMRTDEQIFIINLKHLRELPEQLRSSLSRILRERDTCIGFSSVASAIKDISSLYILAKEALRIGKQFMPDRNVFLYDDYRLIHFLDPVKRPENMFTVCDSRILALAQLDNSGETEYIKTLYIYLLHERSLKAAAAALFIHRNSLVYRLGKINDFLQYDFDDPKVRENTMLSCKLTMLYGNTPNNLEYLLK